MVDSGRMGFAAFDRQRAPDLFRGRGSNGFDLDGLSGREGYLSAAATEHKAKSAETH
jgi:hypothetical protein